MTFRLQDHRRVHFVGVGGIGMSALARYLLATGYQVSGSDRSAGEQLEALARQGAQVHTGHAAHHLDGADLVVVTSAVGPDNPEVREARARQLPVVKRAELLAAVVNQGRGIAVAGTHGKTTTSALIAHLLVQGGLDPTVLIGGISRNLGSNARVGSSRLVVAEADEYDASFLHLRPEVAVVSNVEPEHLDFYGTAQAVNEAFRSFAAGVSGTLVLCADDPVASSLAGSGPARSVTYGLGRGDWQAVDVREEGGLTRFTAQRGGESELYTIPLAGLHNVRNALAALVVGEVLGVFGPTLQEALATFTGVERRLELKGEAGGVLVIDSYAHHPTEIRADLAAVKARFRRPIRVVFQPHTYSRTRAFLSDFGTAFQDADAVYLLDIYAARETDTLGVSGLSVTEAVQEHHPTVRYTESADGTLDRLLAEARSGDLVVTMGAGDVYQLAPRLLDGIKRR
jgi:UDP-N-acetylmuramate--alanine ligase